VLQAADPEVRALYCAIVAKLQRAITVKQVFILPAAGRGDEANAVNLFILDAAGD
jgi:hypothetical protein